MAGWVEQLRAQLAGKRREVEHVRQQKEEERLRLAEEVGRIEKKRNVLSANPGDKILVPQSFLRYGNRRRWMDGKITPKELYAISSFSLPNFKFIYSEEATKFCEIFTLLSTTVHTVLWSI